MSTMAPSHITIDENGVARIEGTRMKVLQLIEAWKSGASTPELLQQAYPTLTLAQIHGAMAYYYDHQGEIDAELDRLVAEYEAARANAPETPGHRKLRQQGLIP